LAGSSTFDFSAILRSGDLTKASKENSRISRSDADVVDNKSVDGNGANDSVVMVLSEDSGDEVTKKVEERIEDQEKDSADDEKTTKSRQHRAIRISRSFGGSGSRNNTAPGGRGHLRQRSGDAAAATLSTGSKEWKGMEQDKIPLPPLPGGDDEEDDDQEQPSNVNSRGDRPRSIDVPNKPSGERSKENSATSNPFRSTIDDGEGFSLGVGGGHESQKVVARSRPRRESYRGRKLAGLSIDSEESSSLTSSGRAAGVSRRARNPTLHSSFSGYMPSPDWSVPSGPQESQGHQEGYWSLQSYHASQPYPQNDMEYGRLPEYARSPSEAPISGAPHFPQTLSSPADKGFRRHSYNPQMNSGHKSMGTTETSFSWLSDRRDTMESQISCQGSETSPLIRSRTTNYDGERSDSQLYMSSSHTHEFEPTDQRRRSRPMVILSPLLQEGRKVFEASSFATIGNRVGKADRRSFLPESALDDDEKYPTFVCPVCQTRQREFFTVTNAPRQFQSASGYIAFYFGIYVIASLYIFGLQEGWGKLDCIYFAGA
jgi:hypothetical protein